MKNLKSTALRLVLLLVCCGRVGSAAPAPPQSSQLREREQAKAAFERSAGAYKKLRSFSISTTETFWTQGRIVKQQQWAGAMLWPSRVFVRPKNTRLDLPLLMDAEFNHHLTSSGLTSSPPSDDDRSDMWRAVSSFVPSLGLISTLLAGEGALLSETVSYRADAQEERVETIFENREEQLRKRRLTIFDRATGFLRSQQTWSSYREQERSSLFTFSRPTSNWKGSLAATDAAIYSVGNVFGRRTFAQAKALGLIKVEPEAIAIFKSAHQKYRAARSFQLRLKAIAYGSGLEPVEWDLTFERPAKWRLEWSVPGVHGRLLYLLNSEKVFSFGYDDDRVHPVTPSRRRSFEHNLESMPCGAWVRFLIGNHQLSPDALWRQAVGGQPFEARVVPSKGKKGVAKRVRIVSQEPNQGPEGKNVSFYDFAPDGTLVAYYSGRTEAEALVSKETGLALSQKFNPAIVPDLWRPLER